MIKLKHQTAVNAAGDSNKLRMQRDYSLYAGLQDVCGVKAET